MITIFSFNINVFASGTVYKSLFIGTNDESVDLKTSVKITDNSLNYVTNITFIVHGIDSSANDCGYKCSIHYYCGKHDKTRD